jgi:ABC-type Fe3+/spermidine/putrescine transport system ATPase subunit
LRIHRELRFSAVYVTHDQIEAMGVAHQIALMRDGRILQIGDPESIYEHPATRYTGEFIGEANFLESVIVGKAKSVLRARTPIGELEVDRSEFEDAGVDHEQGRQVTLMIRPERITMHRPGTSTGHVTGVVDTMLYSGSRSEYVCTVDGQPIQVWQMAGGDKFAPGDEVALEFPPSALHIVED